MYYSFTRTIAAAAAAVTTTAFNGSVFYNKT